MNKAQILFLICAVIGISLVFYFDFKVSESQTLDYFEDGEVESDFFNSMKQKVKDARQKAADQFALQPVEDKKTEALRSEKGKGDLQKHRIMRLFLKIMGILAITAVGFAMCGSYKK